MIDPDTDSRAGLNAILSEIRAIAAGMQGHDLSAADAHPHLVRIATLCDQADTTAWQGRALLAERVIQACAADPAVVPGLRLGVNLCVAIASSTTADTRPGVVALRDKAAAACAALGVVVPVASLRDCCFHTRNSPSGGWTVEGLPDAP